MDYVKSSVASGFIPAINLFVTSRCNMRCQFCFGSCQMRSSFTPNQRRFILSDIIVQCQKAGVEKVTFVGGEPLLYSGLEQAIHLAHELGMATCVVSNGSLVTRDWLRSVSPDLDWIGFSIDSLSEKTNLSIGRTVGGIPLSLSFYQGLVSWVHDVGINLKINTTVCRWNHSEDMAEFYLWAKPDRIKLFQALTVKGVNDDKASDFSITGSQFSCFVARHEKQGVSVVSETSSDMIGSYLMVSPDGCFFDNTAGQYRFSRPIQDVGFNVAMRDIRVDPELFYTRGGQYDWTRPAIA